MKIFGREPAVFVGFIEGVIAFVVSLNLGLSTESAALITAVVVAIGGLLQGWATADTRLGLLGALIKALLALAVGYGLNLQSDQQAALLALLPIVYGFFQRTQTSPLTKGNFDLAA